MFAAALCALTVVACGGATDPAASPSATAPVPTGSPAPPPEPARAPALAPAPAPTVTCGLAGFQADLLAAINAARAQARSCGGTAYAATAPLAWNAKLTQAAAARSGRNVRASSVSASPSAR